VVIPAIVARYRSGVRRLAVAVLTLAVAPAAAAKVPPPTKFHVVFPRQVVQRDRQQSCAVGAPKSVRIPGPKSVVASEKKAVVACEQPPRVNVVNAAGTLLGALRP
jgi:hypothetical protein